MNLPTPSPSSPALALAAPAPAGGAAGEPADKAGAGAPQPGQWLLLYAPDGPLGGTFTCTECRAQAWQPDLLDHTPACAYRAVKRPPPAR